MTIVEFLTARLDEHETEWHADERYIAATRLILDLHKPVEHPLNGKFDNRTGRITELGLICEECSGWDDPYIDQKPYPCATVRIHASVYADHSDYQQEWKP